MWNCFSRWVCKQFVLLPAFYKAYRLLTSSRALGIVKLKANLQQGSKVYSMISCQEAELVEFWVHPLRRSLRSCSLVSQHEFRPSHCGVVSCSRKQCLRKYLSKIRILEAERWSQLYADQLSEVTRAPLQEGRNIIWLGEMPMTKPVVDED